MALLLAAGAAEGASDSRPVVKASEILAAIERGEPVEYDGVIVEGDLDLSGLDLPTEHVERTEYEIEVLSLTEEAKAVDSSISITNSEIRGNVIFSNAIFRKSVDFTGTNFSGNAYFSGAQFSGNAYFSGARFSGDAGFAGSQFSSYARFPGAQFSYDAFFTGAQFSSNADFSEAQFSRHAFFWRAQFSGDAYFSGAQFSGNAYFSKAQFGDYADFSEAQFSGDVTFEDSSFDHTSLILEDANNIRILRLSDATFENEFRICLNGTDYEQLYVHWDQIKDGFVRNGEAYLTLVKNFKNIEYFEDADSCYYQYRQWRQDTKSWLTWSKYVDILARWSCGYGVRPGYTLYWSFGLIFLFGILFWVGNGIQKFACPYHDNVADDQNKKPNRLSFVDSIYFSALVFVSQPPPDLRPTGRWKYAVTAEDVFGWLLLALFLVTLGNVMIR